MYYFEMSLVLPLGISEQSRKNVLDNIKARTFVYDDIEELTNKDRLEYLICGELKWDFLSRVEDKLFNSNGSEYISNEDEGLTFMEVCEKYGVVFSGYSDGDEIDYEYKFYDNELYVETFLFKEIHCPRCSGSTKVGVELIEDDELTEEVECYGCGIDINKAVLIYNKYRLGKEESIFLNNCITHLSELNVSTEEYSDKFLSFINESGLDFSSKI